MGVPREDRDLPRYNEGPPMTRTGVKRGLLLGLAAFVMVVALIFANARHEINETAQTPATNQSTAVAAKK